MPAPSDFGSLRTGTPDATNGLLLAKVGAQQGGSVEIPVGIAASQQIGDSPTPDRDDTTAADSKTDMSATTTTGFIDGVTLPTAKNAGAIALWATFATSTDAITVRMAYYDGSNNPLFMGPSYTITPLSGHRLSASGHYMSEVQLLESYGAKKFRPYIVSRVGSGNVDVFAHPL